MGCILDCSTKVPPLLPLKSNDVDSFVGFLVLPAVISAYDLFCDGETELFWLYTSG